MKQSLIYIVPIVMILMTVSFVSAGMVITSYLPANQTKTQDRTPEFSFTPVTNNASAISCVLHVGSTSQPTVDGVNNTLKKVVATSITPDGSYEWWVNCTSGSSKNHTEIRIINISLADYGASDVAPASINTIVKIIVVIGGLATIIGVIIIFGIAKKNTGFEL